MGFNTLLGKYVVWHNIRKENEYKYLGIIQGIFRAGNDYGQIIGSNCICPFYAENLEDEDKLINKFMLVFDTEEDALLFIEIKK